MQSLFSRCFGGESFLRGTETLRPQVSRNVELCKQSVPRFACLVIKPTLSHLRQLVVSRLTV